MDIFPDSRKDAIYIYYSSRNNLHFPLDSDKESLVYLLYWKLCVNGMAILFLSFLTVTVTLIFVNR